MGQEGGSCFNVSQRILYYRGYGAAPHPAHLGLDVVAKFAAAEPNGSKKIFTPSRTAKTVDLLKSISLLAMVAFLLTEAFFLCTQEQKLYS